MDQPGICGFRRSHRAPKCSTVLGRRGPRQAYAGAATPTKVGVVMATDEPRYMAKNGADSTRRLRSPPVHQETGGSRCDVTASSCADAAGHFGQTHSTEPRERRATRG